MSIELDELRERVKASVYWLKDPETQELAANTAADLTVLIAKTAMGVDVSKELDHARAAALSLKAAAQSGIAREINAWLTEAVRTVVRTTLTLI